MTYDATFFDYVDAGAIRSAKAVVSQLYPLFQPSSVLDVGCGRGGWLAAWKQAGVADVQGVDGNYVDRRRLLIDEAAFQPVELTKPFDLGRKYGLVQCLEVAEHLDMASAGALIDSIVRHGDVILFSAAVPGQGGTHHVNEQPLEYWRTFFTSRGYAAFDALRPRIDSDKRIEPWYRYNSIIYANAAGQAHMSAAVRAALVPERKPLGDIAPLVWQIRKAVLRRLPVSAMDRAALINARLHQMMRHAQ